MNKKINALVLLVLLMLGVARADETGAPHSHEPPVVEIPRHLHTFTVDMLEKLQKTVEKQGAQIKAMEVRLDKYLPGK